ncbi:MAG: DNA repair protein RadC [Armatimonadota bacterium]|nr:DNA repair protein RadC [Armatimonadota bacterium]MDR7539678.1 DNA repair protein RadC [Armatimonadota bacterium]
MEVSGSPRNAVLRGAPARPKVTALPSEARPRERLHLVGPQALGTTELLAIVLGTGTRGRGVLPLAEHLLSAFGSLQDLSQARLEEIDRVQGVGPAKAAALVAAFELGRRAHGPAPASRYAIRTPADAARLLLPLMRYLDREHFRTVLLNTRHEVMAIVEVAVGSLDSAPIHPREVFKEAVRRSAAALILAHNHPSGNPEPSGDDLAITERLRAAGRIVGIDVLDHLITGNGSVVSLRERGAL